MPKTDINRPLKCNCVHYDVFEGLSRQPKYPIELYNVKGQLWIYPNQDVNFEYLPDVIYNGKKSYHMGVHFGKTKGKIWGILEKYETDKKLGDIFEV